MVFSTKKMDHELDRLCMHGMVPWLEKNHTKVESTIIKKAICHRFAVRPEDVFVVKHFPDDFKHRHHRDEATALGRFPTASSTSTPDLGN